MRLKLRLFISLVLAIALSSAVAADSWKTRAGRSLITVVDGMMRHESSFLLEVMAEGKPILSKTILLKSEAPETGVISRDMFVGLTVDTLAKIQQQLLLAAAVKSHGARVSCQMPEIELPDLGCDIEVHVSVEKEQVKLNLKGLPNRDDFAVQLSMGDVFPAPLKLEAQRG